MGFHLKLGARIIVWTVVATALLLLALRAYGTIKDFLDAQGDIPKVWGWLNLLSQETTVLLCIAVGAGLLATFDTWWPGLTHLLGIPDAQPSLEFVNCQDDGGWMLHYGSRLDIYVTVRNQSRSATIQNVHVLLEGISFDDFGGRSQPLARKLQLQHGTNTFDEHVDPTCLAYFRLCSLPQDLPPLGDKAYPTISIAPRDDGSEAICYKPRTNEKYRFLLLVRGRNVQPRAAVYEMNIAGPQISFVFYPDQTEL